MDRTRVATTKSSENKTDSTVSDFGKRKQSQFSSSPLGSLQSLQRSVGNHAVAGMLKAGALQPKLRVSQPNDIYEQEADRVAEQVMRMEGPAFQRKPT